MLALLIMGSAVVKAQAPQKDMDDKYATGLEAVIGYLSLINKDERIDKIMSFILK